MAKTNIRERLFGFSVPTTSNELKLALVLALGKELALALVLGKELVLVLETDL